MNLDASLASAIAGLRVAQEALNTTAHNVANVNTPGFTRKIVSQETLVLGGRGLGATASEIERIVDRFLIQEVRSQQSVLGRSETLAGYQDRLQAFLGAPGDDADISTRLGAFGAALQGLANTPDSSMTAFEVVNLGRDVAAAIGQLDSKVQHLRADADHEVSLTVDQVNRDLRSIAELNLEISHLGNTGQSTSELDDRRDVAIRSLAANLDISTFERNDGVVVVQTARGAVLADTAPRVVHYAAAGTVGSDAVFGRIAVFRPDEISSSGAPIDPDGGVELVSSGVRRRLTPEIQNDAIPDADQLITSQLAGGRLAGLLDARDELLPDFADQLGELAGTLRFAVNAAHNDAIPIPPLSTLNGTRTDFTGFGTPAPSGIATFAVIDPDGTTAAQFQVDLSTAASAEDVRTQINGGLGALGSATWGSDGELQITLGDTGQGIAIDEGSSAITVTDAANRDRTYGLSHYFGLNDFFVLERSSETSLAVRSDLVGTPGRVGTAQLDVTTGPLAATLGGRGDDRGIRALAEALQAQHAVIARGDLPAGQVTISGYASQIVGDASIAAQRGGETATREKALADALEFRAAATSGVNVDEEMARMVQIQQAYTASARLIGVTKEMFDELFRIAG